MHIPVPSAPSRVGSGTLGGRWTSRSFRASTPERNRRASGAWTKTQEPELRHTALSLAAFDELQAAIRWRGGCGHFKVTCDQNEGDGWMLPEILCLAALGLTRTVDAGEYDEHVRTSQPVRSRLGACRFTQMED